MKIKSLKQIIAFMVIIAVITTVNSCSKQAIQNIISAAQNALGYTAPATDTSHVEHAIVLPQDSSASPTNLPAIVDLTPYFPPIGDQGQYGTCVAWSTAYNLKSALDALENNYSQSQLSQASYQYSPKDLFWSLATGDKGSNCNGTNFESALDLIVSRGITHLQTVPYTNLGNCATGTGVTSDLHKIDNYRKIDNTNVSVLKGYLAQKRPIVFGARLGDSFMAWNSSGVISHDTYVAAEVQNAYHAMILVGYSDTKQAFRVANSWSTQWGDNGYIWVDYNFFTRDPSTSNGFCYAAYVASNHANAGTYFMPTNSGVVSGYDLVAWQLGDTHPADSINNARARTVTYNVYNIGTSTVTASQNWNILYLWYDAFNANNYGILIYDYYTNTIGQPGQNGNLASGGYGSAGNWWNHIDVLTGQSVADAEVGSNKDTCTFAFDYVMPKLPSTTHNNQFYLVLIADGFNNIEEYDETNNMLYFADAQGNPLIINDGVIQGGLKAAHFQSRPPHQGDQSPMGSVKTSSHVNTYPPEELLRMIKVHKQSGDLARKIAAFKSSNMNKGIKRIVKR